MSGLKTKLFAIPADTFSFSSFPLSLLSCSRISALWGLLKCCYFFFPLGLCFKPLKPSAGFLRFSGGKPSGIRCRRSRRAHWGREFARRDERASPGGTATGTEPGRTPPPLRGPGVGRGWGRGGLRGRRDIHQQRPIQRSALPPG